MALTGVHIVCSTAGDNDQFGGVIPLMNGVFWSQNLTSAGRTTLSAPRPQTKVGTQVALPLFHIYAATDAWIALGDKNVVATADPRIFLPAGKEIDILIPAGTFVAYTPG